jgi:TolB protein
MTRSTPRTSAAAAAALLTLVSHAVPAEEPPRGITGVVTGEGITRIRIAIPPPGTDHRGADDVASEIATTLRDDLDFTGFFDVIDPALYPRAEGARGETARHEDWLAIGADALVHTRLRVQGERVDLEAWLHDNPSATVLLARRYGGKVELARRVAHQLADDVVRHYKGMSAGLALTRIAFVSAHGKGKELYVMDYDGRRVRRLTTTGTLNLSPAWSPDGSELAFVSWRGRQPGVYVISSEGKLGHLPTVGGELSTAPDWSGDGTRLAYTSDVDGNTELYVLDRSTGRNRRLTFNPAIDTAPAFSPNGREIAFTSDRGGSPQIYVMDADGLNVRRLSWEGNYNDSAAWAPGGDRLAFASRIEGRFQLIVLDLSTGKQTQLTRGGANHENPRWSPGGRHLVFSSDRAGSYDIYTMRDDGTDVRRLTRGRASFTPDWSR